MVKTAFDPVGMTFGRLLVLERLPNVKHQTRYLCRCECGTETEVAGPNLKSGNSTSCGCAHARHGMARTKVYSAWRQMRQRCENQNDPAFPNYGGRGIKVCARWQSFDDFYDDMGPRPAGHTIDRIDNNGPYSPENCRWASWKEQQTNKRSNRALTAFGQTKTLQEWADQYQLPISTLRNRIDRGGWPVETALTAPFSKGRKL